MPRLHLCTIALTLIAGCGLAQTLDLGSMGGPELGERSAFIAAAPYYADRARRLYAQSGSWDDNGTTGTLETDRALGTRALAVMHSLADRALRAEGARNGAVDHRMVLGRLIGDAIPSFEDRVNAFLDLAVLAHTEGASESELASYRTQRAALRAFVRNAQESFGTPDSPSTMGSTVRSLQLVMRPVFAELDRVFGDPSRDPSRGWGTSSEAPSVSACRRATGQSASTDAFWNTLERAERSGAHAPEARRLAMIARDAHAALIPLSIVSTDLQRACRDAVADATAGLLTDGRRMDSESRLSRVIRMGSLLESVALFQQDADRTTRKALDALASQAVLSAITPMRSAGGSSDPLLEAMEVCKRALIVAHQRRSLAEPLRMQGHTRRAWLLMHSEQADREAALFADLRALLNEPRRVTLPSLVSSIARTKTGYERLVALRMSDDWLDELRNDGRLALLLGPTVSQRSRDLLIFTLRDRIRDAADDDVREGALDDLYTLRDHAERYGLAPIEETLREDGLRWLDEEVGSELARSLEGARTSWVDGWVEDNLAVRTRWAERLGMLIRARDLIALAERLDDPTLMERASTFATVLWPSEAQQALRDRVRGLANGAARAALSDDPATEDDDTRIRARLADFESGTPGATALLTLAALVPTDAQPWDDPFERLLSAVATMAPADHPLRIHRYDVAAYVRWVNELYNARSGSDRDAILAHLDEVGADVRARLARD